MALKLASITGWQEERRRALALLNDQLNRARRTGDYDKTDALRYARRDVEGVLREAAAYVIAESVAMRWAHGTWPYPAAA